ncbi:hypothetical protein SAMN05192539_104815 [Paraburkholderia diazotrophica]|uniref:Uncharacterized protein n=1 Tax=Paraburkholderia diazotrophica TaxID=667676 RepID=A0A1H7E933_9BURK|nr:hypothetical protein SAMN05192539_104815 [Paraburkholderia diazotrophica]
MQWNTLDVPLEIGWQCTLVPASQYRSPSGDRFSRFMSDDERKQVDEDIKTFVRYFRPRLDLGRITDQRALDEVRAFLSRILHMAHWNLPSDCKGVERALREAVEDDWLVPIVNREWRLATRYWRPTPAPLNWPPIGGEGGGGPRRHGATRWAAFEGLSGQLSWEGEPVLSGPYDPATLGSRLAAARAALSGGVESVADALTGDGADTQDNSLWTALLIPTTKRPRSATPRRSILANYLTVTTC